MKTTFEQAHHLQEIAVVIEKLPKILFTLENYYLIAENKLQEKFNQGKPIEKEKQQLAELFEICNLVSAINQNFESWLNTSQEIGLKKTIYRQDVNQTLKPLFRDKEQLRADSIFKAMQDQPNLF